VIGLFLLFLFIPGAAFMLFLAFGMWMAFQESTTHDQRRENNECLHCGYNLTANTGGKCPECGKSIN
jgi:hypothetical protein